MKTRWIFLATLLASWACSDAEMEPTPPVVTEMDWREEVRELLNGGHSQPAEKPHMVYYYFNEEENSLTHYTKYFYDLLGREQLAIGLSLSDDTISVGIPKYSEDGKIIERTIYDHPEPRFPGTLFKGGRLEDLRWYSSQFYLYDQAGLLQGTEAATNRRERQLHKSFLYNEQGLLVETLYFSNGKVIDRHGYEYDEADRMIKESWLDISSDSSYRDFFLRYNDRDLLEAKSTKLMMPMGEMGDVFTYEYDGQGRLTAEREFGINWGLPLLWRKRYIYH